MENILYSIHKYLGNKSIINPNVKSKKEIRQQIKNQLTIINTSLPNKIHKMIDNMLLSEQKIIYFNVIPYKIYTIRCDITELNVECIVNPANSIGLGCF